MAVRKQDALDYHALPMPGKISIAATKPSHTQLDLSLAYSPGVAHACLEIARDPELVERYTSRSNLVAVVTNGSAVLGLGNIGARASKPVMEGKAVLFKRFADIDVFDLEVGSSDPEDLIRVVELLEPTFGGVNLEDIKAPECFYIEETLRQRVKIPVFHDDQHGTAIISAAAMLNALDIVGKRIDEVRLVVNGAGAAAVAGAKLYQRLGVPRQNLLMLDSVGVIYNGRTERMNEIKQRFAADTDRRTLADALRDADVFVGLSVKDVMTADMLNSMAPQPIVFALANPDPEIRYETAVAARDDLILATGRSDYPNQVNNVLGFPSIFRGALDVGATEINEEMKLAAVRSLAELARRPAPDSVRRIYKNERLELGPDYIIPKPFDPRVLQSVAYAVAEAAMESGVARRPVNLEEYRGALARRLDSSEEVFQRIIEKAKADPRRIVFPEAESEKILRAAQVLREEGIAKPVLIGESERILAAAENCGVPHEGWEIVSPADFEALDSYADELYELRQRKGCTRQGAYELLSNGTSFGAMMVRRGDADGMATGVTQHYPEALRRALQIIDLSPGVCKVSGLYAVIVRRKIYLLADTTVNIETTAEDLAEITLLAAARARRLDIEPRVALLSFSNFGSARHPLSEKVSRAVSLVREADPDLMVDGEMQADTALDPSLMEEFFPFSRLEGEANVLVFPALEAANASYKLLKQLAGAHSIGPILMGMEKPVAVLQRGFDVHDIVTMAAIAALDAQEHGMSR